MRGETLLLSLSGPDGPPWYPIQLLSLRARLLALTPDTLPQSSTSPAQALALARTTYPDLLPETARTLTDLLSRARQPDEALAVIADAEPLAAREGFLKSAPSSSPTASLALVQQAAPPAAVDPVLATLPRRPWPPPTPPASPPSPAATSRSAPSPPTRPPPTPTPSPRTRTAIAMPMPACEDARCLEIMADVLHARGERERPGGAPRGPAPAWSGTASGAAACPCEPEDRRPRPPAGGRLRARAGRSRASRAMGASLPPQAYLPFPDWNISARMSLPPTNFPPMYTWGMVGQLEYSLIPWRIAGSARTFTSLNSAPHSLRICTARWEKPHWGKLFVPFMKRTTRLLSTVWRMVSWMSLMAP